MATLATVFRGDVSPYALLILLASSDTNSAVVPPSVTIPAFASSATFAIGEAGAANAGIFAVHMLALADAKLKKRLQAFRDKQADAVRAAKLPEL